MGKPRSYDFKLLKQMAHRTEHTSNGHIYMNIKWETTVKHRNDANTGLEKKSPSKFGHQYFHTARSVQVSINIYSLKFSPMIWHKITSSSVSFSGSKPDATKSHPHHPRSYGERFKSYQLPATAICQPCHAWELPKYHQHYLNNSKARVAASRIDV